MVSSKRSYRLHHDIMMGSRMTKKRRKSFLELKTSVAIENKYIQAAEEAGFDINQFIECLLKHIEALKEGHHRMQMDILEKAKRIEELESINKARPSTLEARTEVLNSEGERASVELVASKRDN